ncbi:MAG: ATP synthase subunit I [Pseudomonadota bacterium]
MMKNQGKITLARVLQQKSIRQVNRLLLLQAFVGLTIAILLGIFSIRAGISAIVATAICVVANRLFIKQLFKEIRPQAVKRIIVNFCFGELIKLAFIVVAMLLAIKLLPVAVLSLLLVYLVLQFSLLLAPFCLRRTC